MSFIRLRVCQNEDDGEQRLLYTCVARSLEKEALVMSYKGATQCNQPILFLNKYWSNQSRDAGTLLTGGLVPFGGECHVVLSPSTNALFPLTVDPFKRDSRCVAIYQNEIRGERKPSIRSGGGGRVHESHSCQDIAAPLENVECRDYRDTQSGG